MARIAISYRRQDSDAITGRIFDRLVAHYGKRAVFRDVDSIPFGTDFRKHIDAVLGETDVLVVVIGPTWLGSGTPEAPRIADLEDPVRIEVELAFSREVAVVPVLGGGATSPASRQLPDSIKDLAFRNAPRVHAGQDSH